MDSKSTLRALRNSARPSVVRLRALLLMVSLRDVIRGISASLSQRGSVAMSVGEGGLAEHCDFPTGVSGQPGVDMSYVGSGQLGGTV